MLPYFKADIPTGRSGDWILERFEVEAVEDLEPSADRLDCAIPRAGTFSRLKCGHEVFMTDLYDEWFTQKIALDQALHRGGRLLISGLGLGVILESIFRAPDSPVEHITVLELSRDVIALVAPHLLARYGDKLEILQADVFTWQPRDGARYSMIWHDIWPNPQAPGVGAEMQRLEDRYGAFCDWHGSWPQEWRWVYEQEAWQPSGQALPSGKVQPSS